MGNAGAAVAALPDVQGKPRGKRDPGTGVGERSANESAALSIKGGGSTDVTLGQLSYEVQGESDFKELSPGHLGLLQTVF